MTNIIDFKNKREENKSLYGFDPDRNGFKEIEDMWNGKHNPVTITFNPNNIPLFERQMKRYTNCRVVHNKCDDKLFYIHHKRIIKEKNEARFKK